MARKRWLLAVVLTLAWAAAAAAPASAVDLKRYETKYYTIYSDLDPDVEREAAARMTRMAEEYHDRTRSFAGVIRHKFPFYLFGTEADYHAAGGLPGSAGVFIGSADGEGKLMAFAGQHINAYTWHTVQHEGFHQFAHAVIGGDIPTWLNEGLAEYFGEALFTGDGFVAGVVPPFRLARLQAEIRAGALKPVRGIMGTSPAQWRAEISIANYDQAWSIVHFLVHADGGRYAPAFAACIRQISAGKPFDVAWRTTIGPTDGFEDRWKAYWLAQPRSPTHDLYVRATVATLTSFLARATAERQAFPDLSAFVTAADGNQLKVAADDWLPHSLLSSALTAAHLDHGTADTASATDGQWELKAGRQPTLADVLPDGTRLTGWFTLNGTHVAAVNVETDDVAKVIAAATPLRDAGKKEQARALVQAALRANPRSVAAADARAFVRSCR